MLRALLFGGLLLLAACGGHGKTMPQADRPLASLQSDPPTPGRFNYCYDHNCTTEVPVALSLEQWNEITAGLLEKPVNASWERVYLARAVGLFEQKVGAKTGTSADIGGTMDGWGLGHQLDCVDEAVNTTRFLAMLENAGLLRFHRVTAPIQRAMVPGSFTHVTAVLQEIGGRRWAIDSWFFDNGHEATVAPLDKWLTGWHPEGAGG